MFLGLILWNLWLRCAAASLHYQLLTPEYLKNVNNVNRDFSKVSSSRKFLVQDTILNTSCPPPKVLNIDGFCSTPDITQKFFVYGTPDTNKPLIDPEVPRPKIEYNVVVIKSSDPDIDEKPIVVPPPQQRTVVLVLNKESEKGKRKVIEIDSPNDDPEVFFVNYREGDNPDLPGGIDLKTALEASVNHNAKILNRGSVENELSGYGVETPYQLLPTSLELRKTFEPPQAGKNQGQIFRHDSPTPGTHVDLPSPEFHRRPKTSQTHGTPFGIRTGMLAKRKYFNRSDKHENTMPSELQVSKEKKPPYQEKKSLANHFKKGRITIKGATPVTPKDYSDEWIPFIPSSRVYIGKKAPAPGLWKRVTPESNVSNSSQAPASTNKVQEGQYWPYNILSPTPA